MRVHYYAHIEYDNPGVYDYEYIIENGDMQKFSEEILSVLQNNYNEVNGTEELNCIDIGGWEDFLETNSIAYDDDDWFPHKAIWKCIKSDIQLVLNSGVKDDEKYQALEEMVQGYLSLIEGAYLCEGEYLFRIKMFNNSKDFAEYFFEYLKGSNEIEYRLKPFRKRIEALCELAENRNFPNNDFQEGILGEWITFYRFIFED